MAIHAIVENQIAEHAVEAERRLETLTAQEWLLSSEPEPS